MTSYAAPTSARATTTATPKAVPAQVAGVTPDAAPADRERPDEHEPFAFGRVAVHAPAGSSDVRRRLGNGRPLPAAARIEAEAAFGTDLAEVRVHDSPAAHALAQEQLARAFTVGTDIVFNDGRFAPHTATGRRLLLHELAHVHQQNLGHSAAPTSAAHEAAADAAARHTTGAPVSAGPAAARGIQREPLSADEIAHLDQSQTQARILGNEREGAVVMLSEEYRHRLDIENRALRQRYADLTRGSRATVPTVSTETLGLIRDELAEVGPQVSQLAAAALVNPADHALNTVRGLAVRLHNDEVFLQQLVGVYPAAGSQLTEPLARVRALSAVLAPAVTTAQRWHEQNPAGESLGMMNEAAGTATAGFALRHWERGGWYYISGAAAFVATAAIATLDAAEQLASFGFHDAATAVSQAYTRGDISWNEGERILRSAAWRALLIAAITRGAGVVASRLGGAAAAGLSLAPRSAASGLVAGGVTGGLTAATSLGAQAVLTIALEDQFNTPTARAIWSASIPSGRDYAISIPLAILLGGLGGARAIRLGNQRLIGTTVQTPDGLHRIVAITPDGVVVLQPLASRFTPPPPPPTTITLVFDPVTNSWVRPGAVSPGPAALTAPSSPTTPAAAPMTTAAPPRAPLQLTGPPARLALPPGRPTAPRGPEVFGEIRAELGLAAPGTGGSGTDLASAIADAQHAQLLGPQGAPGRSSLAVQPHSDATEVRTAYGVSGSQVQSMHVGPTSFLRDVLGYTRSGALTVLGDRNIHAAFDAPWKNWAMAQRRAGRTRVTVHELEGAMLTAISGIPNMSQLSRDAIAWRMHIELYGDLGLQPTDLVDLPYPNIPASP